MNVLVAMEFSGIIRNEFHKKGHNAWSCDLLETEIPGKHHVGDILEFISKSKIRWDLIIAHPPCTFLSNSGSRWLWESNSRFDKMIEAAKFFNIILNLNCKSICVENPIIHGYALNYIDVDYTQLIYPWHFGHKETRRTCLWLRNLPNLIPTKIVGPPPNILSEKIKWQKVHHEQPGDDRWKNRSRTLKGIAKAMANQWGK